MIRTVRAWSKCSDGYEIYFENSPYFRFLARVTGDLKIGTGTQIDDNMVIGLPDKPIENFIVGDQCRFFGGKIAPRNFVCGDYVTIHDDVWCYGRNDCQIGHNSWFGRMVTIDCEGKFKVGGGFGAGEKSTLWSHVRHGDVARGCKYFGFSEFIADNDVWLMGRCSSAPAHHQAFSIALNESNLVSGMEFGCVYGGNPAKKINSDAYSNLLAPEEFFVQKVNEFANKNYLQWCQSDIAEVAASFSPRTRMYEKTGGPIQVALMRHLLPEMKFFPIGGEALYNG